MVRPDRRWTRPTAETLDPPSGHPAGGYRSRRDTGPGGPGAELLEEKLHRGRWISQVETINPSLVFKLSMITRVRFSINSSHLTALSALNVLVACVTV